MRAGRTGRSYTRYRLRQRYSSGGGRAQDGRDPPPPSPAPQPRTARFPQGSSRLPRSWSDRRTRCPSSIPRSPRRHTHTRTRICPTRSARASGGTRPSRLFHWTRRDCTAPSPPPPQEPFPGYPPPTDPRRSRSRGQDPAYFRTQTGAFSQTARSGGTG